MKTSDKIIRILKKDDLNILESLKVLQTIENAFIEQLEENINKNK